MLCNDNGASAPSHVALRLRSRATMTEVSLWAAWQSRPVRGCKFTLDPHAVAVAVSAGCNYMYSGYPYMYMKVNGRSQ